MNRPPLHEIATVPNAISAIGFGLVAKGCIEENPVKATVYIAAGRALDLVDGVAARTLHQETDFGAKLDAGLDKLGMAAIISSALYYDRMPKTAAAAVIAHNTLNAGASIVNEIRHPDEPARPSKAGKIGLFVENVGVLSYLASDALESRSQASRSARALQIGGHAMTACGVGLGMIAGAGYLKRATAKVSK